MRAFLSYLGAALLLVVATCWYCQFVYDGDNFYHLAHASVYWNHGIFFRPFPWVHYSVASQYNSDLWWGFHVLLAPLTALGDKVLILIAGPGYLMLLNLLISRWAVIRLGMSHWYGLVMLPASLGYFTRMETVRPQVLSAALLVLVFAAIISEAPWLAVGASFFLGLFHPTLCYMVIMVGGITFLHRGFVKKEWNLWTELSCLIVALSVAIIRPGIPDGLHLMKVQLLDLMQVRRAGEVKNFGVELDRTNWPYFLRAYMSPLIVLAVGAATALRFRSKEKSPAAMWAAFGVVLAALVLSFAITRRGIDQFAPFTILTALLLFHLCPDLRKFTAVIFGIHFTYVLIMMGWQNAERTHPKNATDFRGAANWLINHTQPGELVGQAVWSDFGPLFYWDKHNRFFGGFDPIFQYTYSPETYWMMTINASGRDLGKTSKYNPLIVPDKEEPISTVWPRDLKTKWMIVGRHWGEAIQTELKQDPHVKLRYEDDHARIYEFVP
ncbi:MAG: hypothetical protein JST12_10160 [Armatimonadetes bacterium]|nr:hypothetical protein [Armatimonadota bacterium]